MKYFPCIIKWKLKNVLVIEKELKKENIKFFFVMLKK